MCKIAKLSDEEVREIVEWKEEEKRVLKILAALGIVGQVVSWVMTFVV